MNAAEAIEQRFRACVHCGLCLESCPTYVQLGTEMDSPRGRIVLMRGIDEGRIDPTPTVLRHLDLCLACRACETACPSNVEYGRLIEHFRGKHPPLSGGIAAALGGHALADRALALLLFKVFPHRQRLKLGLTLGRWLRAMGALDLLRELAWHGRLARVSNWLPTWLLRMEQMLPDLPPPLRIPHPAIRTSYAENRSIALSARNAAPRFPSRTAAALFLGCVGEAVFPHVNRATVRVLNRFGCRVSCPQGQVCCGAIHLHGGRRADAQALARANVDALAGDDPIVTNVAGCGAVLKQYGDLLADDPRYADRAVRFARRVRDVSEYLVERVETNGLPSVGFTLVRESLLAPIRVAYHDPCHLCHAQGVREQPRKLLRAIPGLELVELDDGEMCCGAAGTYNLTQPDMADALGRRKLDRIRATGASIIATGNAGCLLHLSAIARKETRKLTFVHPVELLGCALD
jgi:glycolate oxidase iron-sulfur subunit